MKEDWKQVFPFEPAAGDGGRYPAGAGRGDAPACRSEQRAPAQGVSEGVPPQPHAPAAHHADPAFRPHRRPRPGLRRGRQSVRRRQRQRHEARSLQVLLRPSRRGWRRRHLRQADLGYLLEAASGPHCRRAAVHGGHRPHWRITAPPTTIPPPTRPSSNTCPRSCRR